MSSAQTLSVAAIWQQWERRIVNARFPLLQYIGGSRYSAFYLTEHDGAKAALKLVPAGTARASEQVAGWKLAAPLAHPNLIRIFEAGRWHADQDQDMYFAVMEYCEESLADVLRERLLTPAEAHQMLVPTLEALRHLHSRNLCHGYLKPAHILASGDQLKLSSDSVHRLGKGRASGTENPYDAPEKAVGTLAPSGDVWSLGITLFEALTGHLPAAGRNGDAKAAEQLPAPFDAIVAGCLVRDHEQRLPLSAIRALLDKPAKPAVAEPNPVTDSAPKPISNVVVLSPAVTVREEPASTSRLEMITPTSTPQTPAATVPPAPAADLEAAKAAGRRKIVAIAVAFLCVVAIVLAVRGARTPAKSSATKATATVVTPSRAPAVPPSQKHANASIAPAASTGAVLHQVMPVISERARTSITGTVKVKVQATVDPEGRVSHASLASRGPSAYFARQTLQAVRQWTFTPPIHEGQAQASNWLLNFEFRRSGTAASSRLVHP